MQARTDLCCVPALACPHVSSTIESVHFMYLRCLLLRKSAWHTCSSEIAGAYIATTLCTTRSLSARSPKAKEKF